MFDFSDCIVTSISSKGTVIIWDRIGRRKIATTYYHGIQRVEGVKVLGRTILTGGADGSFVISVATEDNKNIQLKHQIFNYGSRIDWVDGYKDIAVTNYKGKGFRVWNIHTGTCTKEVWTGNNYAAALRYPYIIGTGLDKNIHIWDAYEMIKVAVIRSDGDQTIITNKHQLSITKFERNTGMTSEGISITQIWNWERILKVIEYINEEDTQHWGGPQHIAPDREIILKNTPRTAIEMDDTSLIIQQQTGDFKKLIVLNFWLGELPEIKWKPTFIDEIHI